MKNKLPFLSLFFACLTASTVSYANNVYGEHLEGFKYPYPLQYFNFSSQQQNLKMGYMDVQPKKPNGQTVVVLHGKNFCGATWEETISFLTQNGYRVIAPDQIGFCTSSKPDHYQYSFQQLAENTHALLDKLGVKQPILLAHSTGGMLATRYALMYPKETKLLGMVNPIGLEDWKAKGVPYRSIDQWYQRELKVSAESIKAYELKTYYQGQWKPEYDKWVDMLAGLNAGNGHEKVAWNSALIYDMIFTQPVYYEFSHLKVPTVLYIGTGDTTAIGSDIAPPEVKQKIGQYSVLGKEAAKLIPNAELIEFAGMGHSPQMQNPKLFHEALIKTLKKYD
ncbi:alpha/beta hydrolase [Acinetobacter nosocomialis]|uniref:alpha/beta fold hydrolase n=1 Tax=Acinetobacter TaxID=469 RepID=UPI0004B90EAB|nr:MULTISPECIES: alpha/beta hydrolase [Acinetobacter]AJB47404.1 alpha/beta hydrolase [Acinetobacter nosocomialis]EKU6033963.1 alpha/beta hydrolase [Acinetobacter nosocomialis]MBJ9960075.1 alpha/beta hydrolase [Acinetobacter nosocomialis]MBP1476446.1 alpha/beta hydrolase [Acinetobacter nosocomialis]MBP1512240.1 alpha/beta hydrolase [Acinetobacter nosocomialis]